MTNNNKQEAGWQPPPRPDWVARINAEGRGMDIKSVVPLDENSLLEHARSNTGLSDFGDENWRDPFQVLVKSLDDEAELHLMGRLMARSELLALLEQRLKIEDAYKQNPEIEDVEIVRPLTIVGQGRCGSSALQNLLANDPDNNSLLHWQAYFPCPPPTAATYETDPRIELVHPRVTQISRITPEIESSHEFGATLPIETPHIHAFSFRSAAFFAAYNGGGIPSYVEYMQSQDGALPFEYEKRVLKLLQWKNPRRYWVLKSPSLLLQLSDYLKVFPDVALVWIHRDPVKALSSMVNHMGNVFSCRTDNPNFGEALKPFINAEAGSQMLNASIDVLESGIIPEKTLCNVLYSDFIKDAVKVAESIYDYFGLAMSDEARESMASYMRDYPRSLRPKHNYDLGDAEQVREEREAYRRYQAYFGVPDEV
ncbi:MAG: sulfotransferase [Halieaceae bacterium]|nr:sulfotransferase [Halieaceae bacterium]